MKKARRFVAAVALWFGLAAGRAMVEMYRAPMPPVRDRGQTWIH